MQVGDHSIETWRARVGFAVGAVTASLVDRRRRPSYAVLISGSGRSGTTWLAEMLAASGRYRYCFEPFDHRRAPELGHLEYRYVRPRDDDPALVGPVAALFEGRLARRRVDLHNPPSVHPKPGILVKEIYANLAVPWIGTQFPRLRTIVLVRHPGAVAVSRMRLGWPPYDRRMLAQPMLVADHLEPHLDVIKAATTEFERQVVMWCITNSVALSFVRTSDRAITVRYEDLLAEPEAGLRQVFGWLGTPLTPEVLARVDTPSWTSWSSAGDQSALDRERRQWIDAPGADEAAADELMREFGLGDLYPPMRSADRSAPARPDDDDRSGGPESAAVVDRPQVVDHG